MSRIFDIYGIKKSEKKRKKRAHLMGISVDYAGDRRHKDDTTREKCTLQAGRVDETTL